MTCLLLWLALVVLAAKPCMAAYVCTHPLGAATTEQQLTQWNAAPVAVAACPITQHYSVLTAKAGDDASFVAQSARYSRKGMETCTYEAKDDAGVVYAIKASWQFHAAEVVQSLRFSSLGTQQVCPNFVTSYCVDTCAPGSQPPWTLKFLTKVCSGPTHFFSPSVSRLPGWRSQWKLPTDAPGVELVMTAQGQNVIYETQEWLGGGTLQNGGPVLDYIGSDAATHEEKRGALFQLLFARHVLFTRLNLYHNDLNGDNIMFKEKNAADATMPWEARPNLCYIHNNMKYSVPWIDDKYYLKLIDFGSASAEEGARKDTAQTRVIATALNIAADTIEASIPEAGLDFLDAVAAGIFERLVSGAPEAADYATCFTLDPAPGGAAVDGAVAQPPQPPAVDGAPPQPPAVDGAPPQPPAVDGAPPQPPAVDGAVKFRAVTRSLRSVSGSKQQHLEPGRHDHHGAPTPTKQGR